MEPGDGQKVANLRLDRGGRYANRTAPAQIAVEREVRARVYALRLKDRTFQRIAGDVIHPTRKLVGLHRKAKRLRATYEQARALFIGPLEQDLKQLYNRQHDSGEFTPAA